VLHCRAKRTINTSGEVGRDAVNLTELVTQRLNSARAARCRNSQINQLLRVGHAQNAARRRIENVRGSIFREPSRLP
jgi:hypothetical protein